MNNFLNLIGQAAQALDEIDDGNGPTYRQLKNQHRSLSHCLDKRTEERDRLQNQLASANRTIRTLQANMARAAPPARAIPVTDNRIREERTRHQVQINALEQKHERELNEEKARVQRRNATIKDYADNGKAIIKANREKMTQIFRKKINKVRVEKKFWREAYIERGIEIDQLTTRADIKQEDMTKNAMILDGLDDLDVLHLFTELTRSVDEDVFWHGPEAFDDPKIDTEIVIEFGDLDEAMRVEYEIDEPALIMGNLKRKVAGDEDVIDPKKARWDFEFELPLKI